MLLAATRILKYVRQELIFGPLATIYYSLLVLVICIMPIVPTWLLPF